MVGACKGHFGPLVELLVIPVILLGLILLPASLAGKVEAASVTVQVPVDQQTFPAIPGITITQGQTLTITASGTACFDTDCSPGVTPSGSNSGNGSASAKLPGAPRHGLVCGIGGQAPSDLFFVGTSFSGPASASGSLFCGMNEDPNIPDVWPDNSGSWTVSVSLGQVQPTGTLAVTVRRSDTNALLSGATVSLSGGPSSPPTQTTNASGATTFSNLAVGTYTVTASLTGFQTNSTLATVIANTTTGVTVSLAPVSVPGAMTVSVRRSDTNAVLPGASVTLSGGPSSAPTKTTDAGGTTQFLDLLPGTYTVTVSLAGFQTNSVAASVTANTVTAATVILTPVSQTGTLTVTVRRSDTSALLSGATVALSGGPSSPPSQTTSGSGTTTFSNLAVGSYTVTASLTEFQTNSTPGTVSPNTTTPVTVNLAPVQQTGTLTVTVRRSDTSALLSGATVALSGGPSSPPTQTTDGNGATTFSNLTPGGYTVTASLTNFQPNSTSATVVANTTTPVTVFLTPTTDPRPTLALVTPDRGTLNSSVDVTLRGTNFVSGQTKVSFSGGGGSILATDENVVDSTTLTARFHIGAFAVLGPRGIIVTTPHGASTQVVTFTVAKRVVILIHGIFGSPGTFGNGDQGMSALLEKTGRYKVFSFDYSEFSCQKVLPLVAGFNLSCPDLFGYGRSIAQLAVDFKQKCIDNVLKRGKACGKADGNPDEEPAITELVVNTSVDIVAHSMGGLITLSYISGYGGLAYEGDIGKLVTLATPFFGADLGDILGLPFSNDNQLDLMARGSKFLWDLHQLWQASDFAKHKQNQILNIVGSIIPSGDTVVRTASAALPGFNISGLLLPRARHVKKFHFASIADIDGPTHPSYKLVESFLFNGEDPKDCSDCSSVPPLSVGELFVRFVEKEDTTIPIPINEATDDNVIRLDPNPTTVLSFNNRGGDGTLIIEDIPEGQYDITVRGSEFDVFKLIKYKDVTIPDKFIHARRTTVLPQQALERIDTFFTVALSTLKSIYTLGRDVFSLSVQLCCTTAAAQSSLSRPDVGEVEAAQPLIDGYIWVEIPGGARFFLMSDLISFTDLKAPVVAGLPIQNFAGTILSMPIPDSLPTGTYIFFAVGVSPGSDPFNSANWVTNRAQLSVTLTK